MHFKTPLWRYWISPNKCPPQRPKCQTSVPSNKCPQPLPHFFYYFFLIVSIQGNTCFYGHFIYDLLSFNYSRVSTGDLYACPLIKHLLLASTPVFNSNFWINAWRFIGGETVLRKCTQVRYWQDTLVLSSELVKWIGHRREILKQKFQALALPQSRGLMLNMSALEPLYGGRFALLNQLMNLNYLDSLYPYWHSTTVSSGNLSCLHLHIKKQVKSRKTVSLMVGMQDKFFNLSLLLELIMVNSLKNFKNQKCSIQVRYCTFCWFTVS